MGETKKRFELTEDHLKLLRHAGVGWQDCETGAPEIDPKRPYGNSSVDLDVAEILGWTLSEGEDEPMSDYQREKARTLHRETESALSIVLATGTFKAGVYELEGWCAWKLVR